MCEKILELILKITVILRGCLDHGHEEEEGRTIDRWALKQLSKQITAKPCERPNKLNTRSWPWKSFENMRATVTSKLCTDTKIFMCPNVWKELV